MRVHHLSCLTLCPRAGRLFSGRGSYFDRARIECHCLLVETEAHGLVLVDTGIGLDDCAEPGRGRGRLSHRMLPGGGAPPSAATAIRQVEALGFSASDVRHLVLTHLDLDHAGGLPDFPHAKVHVLAGEKDAALARRTMQERERYRPCHFAHGPSWVTYQASGETWRGFEAVRQLEGLPPEILMIPLAGHTRGHACVAVEGVDGGPLVHCGDAYFHRAVLEGGEIPLGFRLFESTMATDGTRIAQNHARLRQLRATHPDLRLFCAHDPAELDRLRGSLSLGGSLSLP